MHAEICPVCLGTGKYDVRMNEGKCHGCDGDGWVEVREEVYYPPIRFPYTPCPTSTTYPYCPNTTYIYGNAWY